LKGKEQDPVKHVQMVLMLRKGEYVEAR